MTKESLEQFFERYEQFFTESLAGEPGAEAMADLYAPEFIAASPLGVMTGRNDDAYRAALAAGYEEYRRIGTKAMHVRSVTMHPIDDLHAVATVAWTAVYGKPDAAEITIDFEVHYLMQELEPGRPKVFGWISGDEKKVMEEMGIE